MSIRNIIDELGVVDTIDKYAFLENKANHVIVSAINIILYIDENFPEEEAEELKKRFINSIKTKSPSKFKRKIHQIKGNK